MKVYAVTNAEYAEHQRMYCKREQGYGYEHTDAATSLLSAPVLGNSIPGQQTNEAPDGSNAVMSCLP